MWCPSSLLLVVSFCFADPQVFKLNQYNSLKNSYSLQVEKGANLYLASNDAVSVLKNIQITSGTTNTTLDKLGSDPFKLTSDTLTLKSTVSESSAALITGFLYATTQKQADDPTFSVIVVNGAQKLSRDGASSTTVILNTQYLNDFPPFDAPDKTTYVTEIEQLSNTKLKFHYEIPSFNWTDVTINQFFENPQTYFDFVENTNKKVLFTNIEPLQINLPYWYITATGPFNMLVDSKFVDEHDHHPTSENTTGLFVVTDVMLEQSVHFTVDNSRERHVGFLVSSFVKYPIFLWLSGGKRFSTFQQNYSDQQKLWHALVNTENDGTLLSLNSTALTPGIFYCQYFIFTGKAIPTDAPTSTSTSTVPPTSTTVGTSTDLATDKLGPFTVALITYFLCYFL